MPASTIFGMSVPWTTTIVACGSAASEAPGSAAAPATAAAPALMNVRRFIVRAGLVSFLVSRFIFFSLRVEDANIIPQDADDLW